MTPIETYVVVGLLVFFITPFVSALILSPLVHLGYHEPPSEMSWREALVSLGDKMWEFVAAVTVVAIFLAVAYAAALIVGWTTVTLYEIINWVIA